MAGLVAITPCAGFVGSMPAIIIGFVAGVICFLALGIKKAFKLDDSLDVIAVHLVGGLVGSIMLGLFADPLSTRSSPTRACSSPAAASTCCSTRWSPPGVTLVYSFVVSFVIAKVIDMTMGLRVDDEEEDEGLDLSQHAETAYTMAGATRTGA